MYRLMEEPCLITRILLGGSWVVINGVISMVTIIITHITGLITPLVITTHEPPSSMVAFQARGL